MDSGPMHGSHAPGGSHRPVDLEDELAADGLLLTPQRDELDSSAALDPQQLEARSTLAQFLRPSTFPAGGADLVAAAEAEGASPSVIALLQRLPPGNYRTVNEVWVTLGGASEARPEVLPAEPTADDRALTERPGQQGTVAPSPSCADSLMRLAGSAATTAVRLAVSVPLAVASRVSRLLRPH
jgi:hypothetical protein